LRAECGAVRAGPAENGFRIEIKELRTMASVKDMLATLTQLHVKQASVSSAIDKKDDNTVDPKTGERFQENTSDAKKATPQGVENAPSPTSEPASAGLNTPTLKLGVKAGLTGEDVPSVGSSVSDPGTSHPAKTGTEKYANVAETVVAGNEILASLAVAIERAEKQAAEKQASVQAPAPAPATPAPATPAPVADPSHQAGLEAGRAAAGHVKAAEEKALEQQIETYLRQNATDMIKYAHDLTDRTVAYIRQLEKQAEMPVPPGADAGAAAGAPPAPAAPPAGGGDVEAIYQALVNNGITPEMVQQLSAQSGQQLPSDLHQLAELLAAEGVTAEQIDQLAAQAGAGGEGAPAEGAPAPAPAEAPAPAPEKEAPAPEKKEEGEEKSASAPQNIEALKAALLRVREKFSNK
jgi:hypothetical protein